ncbi:DUF4167 domain-containing protein [Puniceibacterium sediminis]|uniref:DUF4167 domain-containing protein n=1 Tax=Puniceibacterium sediminis TaxID=1608407 RepID=A0A238W6N6_9RHOB|nr:DUF4167 domain-containing protein [Puniceibacterium sediminis]SNR42091.1 protein of unknown function [Puniceibacterium sediminis]
MRSSKSRSRSKSNRNRSTSSVGNVVNRVFDSSGPDGKVRGTPQQIIDKYNQLARDAQLSNDRVAAENFQQHAEHYLRMLSEAQREQDQRREQQEQENRERQAQRDRSDNSNQGNNPGGNQNSGGQNNGNQNNANQSDGGQNSGSQSDGGNGQNSNVQGGGNERRPSRRNQNREQNEQPRYVAQDVVDLSEGADDDSGLVETPENAAQTSAVPTAPVQDAPTEQPAAEAAPKPKPKRKPRKKPEPKAKVSDAEAPTAVEVNGDSAADAAE